MHGWNQANKITVNPQKFLSLVIPAKQIRNICNIKSTFDNSTIPLQDNINYIGIVIDFRLKFNLHIKTLESKTARSRSYFKTNTSLIFISVANFVLPNDSPSSLLWHCNVEFNFQNIRVSRKTISIAK